MEQIFKIGAVSGASRARRVLSEAGIRARITKTSDGKEGCLWGIAVPLTKAEETVQLLRRAGIRYEVL